MTSDWRRFVFTTSGLLGNVRAGSRLVHLLTAVNLLLLACGIAAAQVTTSGAVGGTISQKTMNVLPGDGPQLSGGRQEHGALPRGYRRVTLKPGERRTVRFAPI